MINNMASGGVTPTVAKPSFTDVTVDEGRGVVHPTVRTAVGG